jgi:hypothetical protein
MIAIPLVARDRAVAVLYADSAGLEPDAVNLEALETLVRVAGMAVELLATRRAPATTAPQQPAEQAASVPAEAAAAVAPASVAEPAPTPAEETAAATQPEAVAEQPAAAQVEEAQAEEAQPAAVEPPVEEPPALATPAETTTPPTAEESFAAPEQLVSAPPAEERGIAPFAMPEAASAPTGEPSVTPLGGGRRYGQDAPLPIEVGEDERRFHNDARRFARLLVSEIKLYNEQKVRDGRTHGDLYERLREEIDRSRQMYDKRADPRVSARYDYFHHELVNTLAEGNADKLGREYPGAQVAA